MKFSRRDLSKPLSRTAARNAALINQLATPGLGSLMAGRILPGLGQLLLFLAGFMVYVAWSLMRIVQTYNQFVNDAPAKSFGLSGGLGLLLAVVAWLWSLGTSISLLREAKKNESQLVPPKIFRD